MRTLFALILLFPLSALGGEHPLNGPWSGSGTLDTGGGPGKFRFELAVNQTDTALNLHECWFDPATPKERACIDTTYELAETYKIMYEGHRIGEAYNNSIHIFLGERMVSEQMVLTLGVNGILSYRYLYANYDGASILREAELTR